MTPSHGSGRLPPEATVPSDASRATTEDLFLGGALKVLQPRTGYRAGLDAVLLAAACPASPDVWEKCLDCGAGAGVVGLAVARRVGTAQVTMVERSAELTAIATRNIENNALSDRCRVVVGDVTRPLGQLGDLAQAAGTFDHVLANPPFYAHGDGTRAPDPLKDGSHAMEGGQLEGWARFAAAMTRPGGSFTLIHRPSALAELLACLDRRFGRLWILPLHPREGEPASRIIVQGIKASRAELRVLPGRVLHRQDGHGFTAEFDDILRRGAPLDLAFAR